MYSEDKVENWVSLTWLSPVEQKGYFEKGQIANFKGGEMEMVNSMVKALNGTNPHNFFWVIKTGP